MLVKASGLHWKNWKNGFDKKLSDKIHDKLNSFYYDIKWHAHIGT